ncbi:tetratricopeptide repeat-containing sensor histidine kinase [Flavobacterium sp. MMLR14_040]|uniref:tetratricopeptide repeat-containing sensor histidine kinase n=1 Tax=Flavobacterium sp. MMLR14_040 TaxID=3093843 RepID=UPI00298F56D8|nr:tetratricopeptide repeat-containing sensor histidine kinase [Flavobacterium sp. MMLR14_040]MDW8849166.1 tetratricopeptide repeat-containing sensor histidine kinase [Flavobacterium sp. MMLR14_040]
MIRIKLFATSVLLFVSFFLFSQEPQEIGSLMNIEIKAKSREFNKNINFDKAQKFFRASNWDSTLVYSMKEISNSENKELVDYCHYFRGIGFKEKKLLNESKKEFNKISNNFRFFYKVKMKLGEIAVDQKEFKMALQYFQQVEKFSDRRIYDMKNSTVLHNIGLCYLHLKNYDKAEDYLFKSSKVQEVEKDTLLLIGSYMDLANLYYEQYKDSQAIPYFEKAYHLSKKVNSFNIKRAAAKNMAVVEENRKNFPLALVYRKEFEQWKDSLNDQNKVWAIADLEKKFAVKQKQKEVDVLAAENKVKIAERNGFIIASVLLFILFGTGVYFYRQKIKNNKIILAQKNELDELNATKDKLFSIVSHDLRSSVNALKTSNGKLMENLKNKNFTELDVLLHTNSTIANGAYNLLDNLLNWALLQTKQAYFYQESLHLATIVQHVEYNYKPLMLNANINFNSDVSKTDYVFADMDSLKIIIRNMLDNAIKFSKENGAISIYSRPSSEEFCYLVIEDTGLGMNETTRQELLKETVLLSKKKNDDIIGTGLGMQLCKSLIRKNGGKLEIESEENVGTKMIIILPKFKNHG